MFVLPQIHGKEQRFQDFNKILWYQPYKFNQQLIDKWEI